jgi:DNA-directed RNA polymerase specialized sigma24 family protein
MNKETNSGIDEKLCALLALTALQLSEDKPKSRKVEEILCKCGVRPDEIAKIVGKNEAAVRKTLQRAGVNLRHTEPRRK